MSYYSYKITRDYGFAPNPFFGYCTLACCKPHIRERASVNDWIFGTGSVENNLLYHLIFLMRVTEKISFEEYWSDPRFSKKKPVLNGSLKQMHGDNIYHREGDIWRQLDSHHSFPNGQQNEKNLQQDLSGKYVLVSNNFIYLGDKNIRVANQFTSLCPDKKQRDYITIRDEELANEFILDTAKKFRFGLNGFPINWNEYNQLSLF